jgi:deoxycytidine triphosphate deaminase
MNYDYPKIKFIGTDPPKGINTDTAAIVNSDYILLSDKSIKESIKRGDFEIDNFEEKNLQPASYDCGVGEEGFSVKINEKIDIKNKGIFVISPADFAVISTYESFKLSNKVAAKIGLRSDFTRKGLILLAGPQIDPGFEGVLNISLVNMGPRDITLTYKEPICTLEFFGLSEPSSKPYSGPFQNQKGLSPEAIKYISESRGITLGQVIEGLGSLSTNVSQLTQNIKSIKWVLAVLAAINIPLVIAFIAMVWAKL